MKKTDEEFINIGKAHNGKTVHYQVTSVTTSRTADKEPASIIQIVLVPIDEKYPRDFSNITLVFGSDNFERGTSFECGQRFELKEIL